LPDTNLAAPSLAVAPLPRKSKFSGSLENYSDENDFTKYTLRFSVSAQLDDFVIKLNPDDDSSGFFSLKKCFKP